MDPKRGSLFWIYSSVANGRWRKLLIPPWTKVSSTETPQQREEEVEIANKSELFSLGISICFSSCFHQRRDNGDDIKTSAHDGAVSF